MGASARGDRVIVDAVGIEIMSITARSQLPASINAFEEMKSGFFPFAIKAVVTPHIHRIVDKNSTTRHGNHIICLSARLAVNPAVPVAFCHDSIIDLHRLIGAAPMFA